MEGKLGEAPDGCSENEQMTYFFQALSAKKTCILTWGENVNLKTRNYLGKHRICFLTHPRGSQSP